MAKYASGFNEVFMDVSKIPIHKKICRKVTQQDPSESRRLWREVTYGLKVKKCLKYVFLCQMKSLRLRNLEIIWFFTGWWHRGCNGRQIRPRTTSTRRGPAAKGVEHQLGDKALPADWWKLVFWWTAVLQSWEISYIGLFIINNFDLNWISHRCNVHRLVKDGYYHPCRKLWIN